jgi:hypothetical protein
MQESSAPSVSISAQSDSTVILDYGMGGVDVVPSQRVNGNVDSADSIQH